MPETLLRTRIAILGTAVASVAIVLFGVLVATSARVNITAQEDQILQELSKFVAGRVTADTAAQLQKATPATIDVGSSSAQFIEVVDGSGNAVYSTGLQSGLRVQIPDNLLQQARMQSSPLAASATVGGVPLRLNIYPLDHLGTSQGGWTVAGESTLAMQGSLQRIYRNMVVAGVILLGITAISLWLFTRRSLRPLADAAITAAAIRNDKDLRRRIPTPPHHDELGHLVTTINGMLDELETTHAELDNALTTQRRFIADASHELRTPLTSLLSNVDFLAAHPQAAGADRDAAIADIAAEAQRMKRMLEDLLSLAHADAGVATEMTRVDLAAICTTVVRQATRTYPSLEFTLDAAGPLTVSGNHDLLSQLVWILINNISEHAAGATQAAVRVARDGNEVHLCVTDDGAGIAATDLPHIFHRFYQADASRQGSGSGLGLAIATEIVAAHHGSIEANNVSPHGAEFVVRLPL